MHSTEVTKMSGSSGFQAATNDRNNVPNQENNDNPEKAVSIFSSDNKKHDDLKQMLDSNKDTLKLEAMKRIIGLIAKGKDASDLFPAVVKNVVSKNVEIKKLVYVYLTRYAEEQQDLALLSISTFQRALKDPNQLIRASALRVLSSIRVPIIVTIMMLAIKEAVTDMSPYVRKTAALAIPKLFSMDAELKDDLVVIIEKLLADRTTLVAGSAIHAFEAVCPERIDLIHKNFRKLCNLLIDVDEWGQVMIINMLTRYSRTQFTNPNVKLSENADAHNEDDDLDEEDKNFIIDPDHRLLLKSTKPLLQSRNSSVVMAVAQLYFYLAPLSEVNMVAKALVRLLRAPREVQIIVLKNVVTIAQKYKDILQQYIKNFFIHSDESIHVKLLKLEILTSLSNESNIATLLIEFQTYILSNDKEFAAAAVHSIGRCASSIPEVTEACLSGLVSLISKKDETIVAESVVVLKRLLQQNPSKNADIIKHLAKMTNKVTIPMARASILWLIGEYSDYVPKIAPDVLRQFAKSFCDEEEIVKLQIVNLAVKLYVTNQKQTSLLVQYVLNLAKYDQNYDIRDRARFFRALTLNSDKCPVLGKHAKKILLGSKPAPVLESAYKDSDQFQLGTLSHSINSRVNGYQELPDFPQQAPDPTVRNVEVSKQEEVSVKASKSKTIKAPNKSKTSLDAFYSNDDDADENQSTEGPDPSSESSGEEVEDVIDKIENSTSEDSEESSEESSESDDSDDEVKDKNDKVMIKSDSNVSITTKIPKNLNSNESSSSSTESSEESESESEDEKKKKKPEAYKKMATIKKEKAKEVSLLDLDFNDSIPPPSRNDVKSSTILSPSLAFDLNELSNDSKLTLFNDCYIPKTKYELLSRISGNGLQVQYCFSRSQSLHSPKMTNIRLIFTNFIDQDLNTLQILSKKFQPGVVISDFPPMNIPKGGFAEQIIGIDFNETINPVQLEIGNQVRKWSVSLSCRVGELFQPNFVSENEFDKMQMKLKGMNEISNKIDLPPNSHTFNATNIKEKILENANMCQIPCSTQNTFKFSGLTLSNKIPLYLSLKFDQNQCKMTINCEKLILANMLAKEIKEVLLA